MFVPVVTKDMQLFPQQAKQQQQHQRRALKNVRSRAQSLEANIHIANSAAISVSTLNNVNAADARSCCSVGALPTSSAAALQQRSPPKISVRKPLESIVEGVALRSDKNCIPRTNGNSTKKAQNVEEDRENDSSPNYGGNKSKKTKNINNKSTPDLNALKITENQMQMSANGLSLATTSSSPGLYKTPTKTTKPNGGRSIVKWLTNTLKGKSSSKDHSSICAKCARLDDNAIKNEASSCDKCLTAAVTKSEDDAKTWRSIGPQNDADQMQAELSALIRSGRKREAGSITCGRSLPLPSIKEAEVVSISSSTTTS